MNEATIHSVLGTKKMIYDHSWRALTAAEISVQQGEAERGYMGSFFVSVCFCVCMLCVWLFLFILCLNVGKMQLFTFSM